MKIFGIELFNKKKIGGEFYGHSVNQLKKSKYLPDFYKGRGNFSIPQPEEIFVLSRTDAENLTKLNKKKKKINKKEKKSEERLCITPKGIYEMKWLNEPSFAIKTDPKYVDEQLESFKERLSMIKISDYDMENGSIEIQSMVIRLENRKKYPTVHKFFEKYPYTKTEKINTILSQNDHLKMGLVDQFLADLPQEAIDVMKEYKLEVEKMCEKYPLFYIIANKKDFQKTDKRKDPILLVQSPFGHFWQILGAWDEEMLLLSDL